MKRDNCKYLLMKDELVPAGLEAEDSFLKLERGVLIQGVNAICCYLLTPNSFLLLHSMREDLGKLPTPTSKLLLLVQLTHCLGERHQEVTFITDDLFPRILIEVVPICLERLIDQRFND